MSKHFSYAIHREVRVQIYALCNGKELIVYHVDILEPIFQSKIENIEENWEELYKVLSPLAFQKPEIFRYKPDFGIRLLKSGAQEDFQCHFMGTWISTLGRLDESTFTFTSIIPFGEECMGSFDFTKDQFDSFMNQVPSNKYKQIKSALTSYPFNYHAETQEESFEVAFSCGLGEAVHNNGDEYYLPLKVIKFIEFGGE